MSDLTLVIPAKNERQSLPNVLEELKIYDYKKIIVLEQNDVETIEAIKNFDCEILFQINKGYGDALIYGVNNVKTKYFCIFNADGSFNPIEIEDMIKKMKLDNLDLVFASRYQKSSGSEDDTIITYVGNFIFTLLGKIFFSLNITDILYTFVLGKTESVVNLNLSRKDFSYCIELPIKAKKQNLKLSSISSYERKRIAGKKKVNAIKDGFLILKQMIFLYFGMKP
jgi:glycosyltransferase involved in cell wall biosynthesis